MGLIVILLMIVEYLNIICMKKNFLNAMNHANLAIIVILVIFAKKDIILKLTKIILLFLTINAWLIYPIHIIWNLMLI